ncbi:MAG: hypothetical protein JF608_08000 [Sphingomonadales bacterium]|jgi:hypothetical protein|nr:hypothetical protein [Sphingomonadales bacterium]
MAALKGERVGHPTIAEQTGRIVAFLDGIGIPTAEAALDEDGVLPAMTVRDGTIIYDPARLERPGDLLHEGGHIAMTDPVLQATVSDFGADHGTHGGDEMAAIAWSWAAAIAAGLDPRVAFHPDAYRGEGEWLQGTFAQGHYIGLPMLRYYGLARFPHEEGEQYPAMIKWLR